MSVNAASMTVCDDFAAKLTITAEHMFTCLCMDSASCLSTALHVTANCSLRLLTGWHELERKVDQVPAEMQMQKDKKGQHMYGDLTWQESQNREDSPI